MQWEWGEIPQKKTVELCEGNLDDNNNNIVNDEKDHPIHKHKNLSHNQDDCHDLPLMTVLSTLYLEKDGKIKIDKLGVISIFVSTIKSDLVSHIDLNKQTTIVHTSMKSLQATILLI